MVLNLSKYAKFVIKYCVDVKHKDKVLILGPMDSLPLIKEIYREAIKAGGHVSRPFIDFPGKDYIFHSESKDFQLEYTDPVELFAIKNVDVLILIIGAMNTRELSNISPDKVKSALIARGKVMAEFYSRGAIGELKWAAIPYPLRSMAQEASMSQEELAKLINTTCFLDKEDPIAEWKKISSKQQKYVDYLKNIDQIKILSKNTDLTMSVKDRIWINSDGKQNLPDGEIFTGPVEDSLEGKISFSYPLIHKTQIIEDIILEFKEGKVVKGTASKGQKVLDTILSTPGAKRVGEIAIGTNWAHTKYVGNIQFDEKLGGTVHLAVGNGYPETGSKNQSSIHKDMLCDMKTKGKIFADGELIYEKGKFLI